MMKRTLLIMLCALLLSSCRKENMCDCFRGTGEDVTEIRETAPFTEIRLEDNIHLVFTPDSVFSVKISGGEKLMPRLITESDGHTLYIRNDNRCNWVRSYKRQITAEVSAPALYHLQSEGSGDIRFTRTLVTDSFTIDCYGTSGYVEIPLQAQTARFHFHTGVSDLKATGSAGVCYVYSVASGMLHLEDLHCGYVFAENKGTGNFYVRAKEELGATVSWTGNIYYYGRPAKVSTRITGSGAVIPME